LLHSISMIRSSSFVSLGVDIEKSVYYRRL
jgi:hypothetical protein